VERTCFASLAPAKGKVKTSWPASARPCCLAREGLVVRVCHPHLGNMEAKYREAKCKGSPEHKTQQGLIDCYVQNITEQCDVTTTQASFVRSKALRDGKCLYEVSSTTAAQTRLRCDTHNVPHIKLSDGLCWILPVTEAGRSHQGNSEWDPCCSWHGCRWRS